MQASSGSYKPVSLVVDVSDDEQMDTDVQQHNTNNTDSSFSCVCSGAY